MITKAQVGWVYFGSAGVANTGIDYAFKTPEPGVWTPESAQSKGSGLRLGWLIKIDGRNHNFTTLWIGITRVTASGGQDHRYPHN